MSRIRKGKMISFMDIDVDKVQTGIVQKIKFDRFSGENIYIVRTDAGREFEVRDYSVVLVYP